MPTIPSFPLRSAGLALVETAMRRRRWVMWGTLLITLVLGAQMVRIQTDTDPENMLADDDPVRVRNAELAAQFGSTNSVFIGLISEAGVVSPAFLAAASELIVQIRAADGVVPEGIVSFELAQAPYVAPESMAEAEALVAAVAGNELLRGFAITEDGTGLSVLVPLTSKSAARGVANLTRDAVSDDPVLRSAEVRIAGLPLAEEEFGREMFLQMGLFAPLAGMLIFALMLFFFRKVSLVLAAMAVAMVSVIWTMGLLIGLGFTVHIMASMIPIFLMPIAILDSIHVLSEFLDRYAVTRDRRATLRAVYREVMMPITYTTLTTAIAFASLMITPIPPVQVFGAFVAFGIVVAWLMTLVLIPALIMSVPEESLDRLARMDRSASNRWFASGVRGLGRFATRRPRLAPAGFVVLALAAIPGILMITVNDNPVRWFTKGSEIRQASITLNETFAGTFQANFLITADESRSLLEPEVVAWVDGVTGMWDGLADVGASSTFVDAMRVASVDGAVGGSAEASGNLLAAAAAGPAAPLVASLIDGESRVANLQLRLTSGDNQAMQRVLDATDAYMLESPLPAGLSTEWAGETYLNLVWQNKMVSGMFNAFMTTLAVAFVLMVVLFRSVRWAVLAIVPMAGAIIVVYGLAGFIGKDYDMPMAVLSTLVLGIGIDFAIHFIERFRSLRLEHASSAETLAAFFEEPARALTRNAVIIALGFVPLLFASLVPYIIVGALLLTIMTLSWFATIVVLPGIVRMLDRHLPLAQSPVAPEASGVSAPAGSPGG